MKSWIRSKPLNWIIMRIDELLNREKELTQNQYEKIKRNFHKITRVILVGSDGWDFQDNSTVEKPVARRWVRSLRTIRAYEKKHGIDHTPDTVVVHLVSTDNGEEPDWPEELKPYQDKVDDHILEAYFCHKFGLPTET